MLYYYDFRGRKYPDTAFLHEQGTDVARGLLLRADRKPIGVNGFKWLLISIASNWAGSCGRSDGRKSDKIPLRERIKWVLDNEDTFLGYAENPKVNTGWMYADKPWQFIAACIELKRLRIWQYEVGSFDNYEFLSGLEAYIDGSNNGSQHLAALTKDEVVAEHVNLTHQTFPGDLYTYVGEHVWAALERETSAMSEAELKACNAVIDDLIELKQRIATLDMQDPARAKLIEEIHTYKRVNGNLIKKSAPAFWMRITDIKDRRKVVKRNIMTIPYGGTPYGLGEQQISDARRHGIPLLNNMEHRYGAYMGRQVYNNCKSSIRRPMLLLDAFAEAGAKAEAEGRFLSWHVPVTNFPVVQHYVEGTVKKLWVQYGPPKGPRTATKYYENTLQIAVSFLELRQPSKGKQAQSASPNAIHSLDAAHLLMTVCACDFPVTTIHDSFGALLSDMDSLFVEVRRQFVKLYKTNPLEAFKEQLELNLDNLDLGTYNIDEILESEYAFV